MYKKKRYLVKMELQSRTYVISEAVAKKKDSLFQVKILDTTCLYH